MSARIFGAAALIATLASASNVHVHNNCNFMVKATPSQEGTDALPQILQPGQTFSAPAEGSAHCLKLYGPGTNDQKWAQSPTQLEWSTWTPAGADTILSYDLSDIDMGEDTTFLRHGMNLTSQDPSCDTSSASCRPAICKAQGAGSTTPCQDAYNNPFDTRTLGASAAYDINMVLCTANEEVSGDSDSGSESSSSSQAAPAPASYAAPQPQTTMATSASAAPVSYTTAAPVQEAADGHAYEGNVVTQWVKNTDVVTQVVTAREAEPTMEKRYAHPHGGHAHHAHHA